MKKRINYFIIAFVIVQLVISICSIFSAKSIIESTLAGVSAYPEALQERVTTIYQNHGIAIVVGSAIICILIDLLLIYFAYKDELGKRKGLIIFLLIVTLFAAVSSVVELMAIVNLILVLTIKKEKSNLKKEIPKLEKEKVEKKEIFVAVSLILVYFSCMFVTNLEFFPDGVLGVFLAVLIYCLLIFFSILAFKDKLKEDIKAFGKNFGAYIGYLLLRYAVFFCCFALVNIVCMVLVNARSANQEIVEQIPILIQLPLAVIYAPIVEEAVFRGCLRRIITNDKIFIVVSAVMFGLIHTAFSETSIVNLFVLAVPYACMGAFFAYLYVKTNNMLSNVFCHFANNLFSTLVSALAAAIILL